MGIKGEDLDSFGANDWLIAEMRQKYDSNPSSVGADWVAYFKGQDDLASVASTENVGSNQSDQSASIGDASARQPVIVEEPPGTLSGTVAPTDEVSGTGTDADLPAVMDEPAMPSHLIIGESPDPIGVVGGLPADAPSPHPTEAEASEPKQTKLRGASLRTAQNMDLSLQLPTATSVRSVPMKLVIDQRTTINNFLRRNKGGKVSFTHLIAFAMIQALAEIPAMNVTYGEVDGKPHLIENRSVNLGLAVDLVKSDGTRQLVVPNIPGCERLDFAQFLAAYQQLVQKARDNKLTLADFAGTTATLTNPGGIGTNHSVPRLMPGQGVIVGVGSIDYPAEFQGASLERINAAGVSKITTLTSTYDHRVIQGAQSGEFLKRIHELLLGADDFYEKIFESLRIPYAPLHWDQDVAVHRNHMVPKEARVLNLIRAYRHLGHLMADTDPLLYRMRSHPDLKLSEHGLTIWDLDREFPVGDFANSPNQMLKLREILGILQDSYCHTLGIEYMHMVDPHQRRWIQERFEGSHVPLPRDEHLRILDRLTKAEIFETFLQTKFVGQKRFSLEGGESAIVALDEICEQAADDGLAEVVIGMPHRGRLNVLANIVGKSYAQIFQEFEGQSDSRGSGETGDVKYHLGAEGSFRSAVDNEIKVSVAANPSHLEAVDPVVEGIARAKLDRTPDPDGRFPVVPILLHGDAAFAGQGVVYETLQMSQLRGYRTGGTIHVIVNNQIGFTTAPVESRSSGYCTDIAKAIQAPILHVNGDDPDAVVRAAKLAFEFRQEFHKDVVIDVVCYRRRGHNEGDDPSFTQPLMYDLIEQKRSTRTLYTTALVGRGDITEDDVEAASASFRAGLESAFTEVKEATASGEYRRTPNYPPKLGRERGTKVAPEVIERIAAVHAEIPEGFHAHPKVAAQMAKRAESMRNGPIDWATAEALAFGSLLLEGRPVRLAGQDSRRGTFTQRFAAIVDRQTNDAWVPMKHLSDTQGRFDVYDSLLSEYAALGFEYGYSVAAPEALVLWEAQFGDFANGAQTVADEFISSGNAKWTQKSGVVLLLPHGYEGQGPDHSSARLERWLQLCAENALAVCTPTTPASYFHLLRTHAFVNWHRPVVIATPKSMLRNKQALSPVSEFTEGGWKPALADDSIADSSRVNRVLLCSGKVRWDLVKRRASLGLEDSVAIISLERLYPLPAKELALALAPYDHVTDIRFVQDEPLNQGSWRFMIANLPQAVAEYLPERDLATMRPVTRPAACAPAVGSQSAHEKQQETLLAEAFADD